jgi:hypothetical protein
MLEEYSLAKISDNAKHKLLFAKVCFCGISGTAVLLVQITSYR